MKKILAMALAAIMVVGFSATVFASSKIDFSGYYKVRYMYEDNFKRVRHNKDADSDAYFNHRLRFNVTVQPADFITLNWRFEAPNNARFDTSDKNEFETKFIYADIDTQIGVFKVGRINGLDMYGLTNIGYMPEWGDFITVGPFEEDRFVDGIGFVGNWDNNFALKVLYGKLKHNNSHSIFDVASLSFIDNPGKDNDHDMFVVEPSYRWSTGAASLALSYERNMNDNYAPYDPLNNYYFDTKDQYAFFVNPAAYNEWDTSVGQFAVHVEGKFGWAEHKYKTGTAAPYVNEKVKQEGYAFYADVDYNYGPGNVTLAGWYSSGNREAGKKQKDIVKFGDNFYPFLVAYNSNGLGYNDWTTSLNDQGHWAVAAWVHHSFRDDIKGRLAVGYFGNTDDVYRDKYAGASTGNKVKKDSLGVEVDAGLEFQLMENLTLETSAGYMFNGDYYKYDTGGKSPSGTFTWANALTIEF